jgi:hypothetical protein
VAGAMRLGTTKHRGLVDPETQKDREEFRSLPEEQ